MMEKTKSTLGTLSDRLRYVLELTGTRKIDLARAIDVKPQVIQFLCSSNTKASRFTFEIATALGLNTRWLATGKGVIFIADSSEQPILGEYKKVPRLSIEDLLSFDEKQFNFENSTTWELAKTKHRDIFCFQQTDTSMSPTIPVSSLVFLSKTEASYIPNRNEIVLAYIKKEKSVLLRETTNEGEQIFLSPKNHNMFKSIILNNGIVILGKVVECRWNPRT